MSKKKKHPVRRMTEQDYANYLMALKDEEPIMPPPSDGVTKNQSDK